MDHSLALLGVWGSGDERTEIVASRHLVCVVYWLNLYGDSFCYSMGLLKSPVRFFATARVPWSPVLFKDERVIVLNKKAGVSTQVCVVEQFVANKYIGR
jgi:hypothetical protein